MKLAHKARTKGFSSFLKTGCGVWFFFLFMILTVSEVYTFKMEHLIEWMPTLRWSSWVLYTLAGINILQVEIWIVLRGHV